MNNVNWAYSAYSSAVDQFNSLVRQYNATPSTISEPVYLPYTFEQGRVHFGWKLDVTVAIGREAQVDADKESVVTDFVRLGNKATDQNEEYRSFDEIDIDLSADAGLGHLYKTVTLVKKEMNAGLVRLATEPIADLSPEEAEVLGWLYHPWGRQSALTGELALPVWVSTTAAALQLKREPPAPPPCKLEASPHAVQGPLDLESAAATLAQFVCQTISSGAIGTATGTATLVGPNGLILTCSHVLASNEFTLDFPTGPWQGSYEGELLFVNSERDVALVRAKGLANDRWADVRLGDSARAGETIIAIGNPAMDVGGQNRGGVSSGVVSNPKLELGSSQFLSADISVASGSSGGPLFSLKDGKLIGVVQRIATAPGFPSTKGQVAASGFLCLAAAAPSLRSWLGLEGIGD